MPPPEGEGYLLALWVVEPHRWQHSLEECWGLSRGGLGRSDQKWRGLVLRGDRGGIVEERDVDC